MEKNLHLSTFQRHATLWTALAAVVLSMSLYGVRAHADSNGDLEALMPNNENATASQTSNFQAALNSASASASNSPSNSSSNSQGLEPLDSNSANANPDSDNADATVQANQKLQTASDRNDEMELNDEVNSLEQYGDAAAARSARSETARLAQQDKRLQHKAVVLKYHRNLIEARVKRLQRLYEQRMIQDVLVRKKAQQAELAAQRTERTEHQLRSRVQFKNVLIAGSRSRERQALRQMALMRHQNHELKLQIVRINRYLKLKHKRYEQLRMREARYRAAHRSLYRKMLAKRHELLARR